MKTGKKLVLYSDGSYGECKGGWSFLWFKNEVNSICKEGYGCNHAIDSVQTEIIACIQAISNLPSLNDIIWEGIEVIEIRMDYMNLVKFINYRDNPYLAKKSKTVFLSKYAKELLELLNRIKQLPYKVKAKKVSRKDYWLKKVDKYAKHALRELSVNDLNCYSQDVIYDNHKEILFDVYDETTKTLNRKWFQTDNLNIAYIPVNCICITEKVHLQAKDLNFGIKLGKIKLKGSIENPIAVRLLEDGTYTLVAGISRLCAAKLLGFNEIPAFICDMTHIEFMLMYNIEE